MRERPCEKKDKGKEKLTAQNQRKGGIRQRFSFRKNVASSDPNATLRSEIFATFEPSLLPGPRNKNLATWHLQYIIHACLHPDAATTFSKKSFPDVYNHSTSASLETAEELELENSDEMHVMVEVYGQHFDLTSILKAGPDFNQIYLAPAHLDSYAEYFSSFSSRLSLATVKRQFGNPTNLHVAEERALNNWSGSYYKNIQLLLRTFNYPSDLLSDLRWVLATIAIMCNSFKRPQHSCITAGTRNEFFNKSVLAERKKNYANKKPTVNRGFTAVSAGGTYNPTTLLEKRTIVRVQQSLSLHPDLISIAMNSKLYTEREILAQPNQQFIYMPDLASKKRLHDCWLAIPVRSIDPLSEYEYQPDLAEEEMEEIRKKSNRLMLVSALHPLLEYKKMHSAKLQTTRLKFFDKNQSNDNKMIDMTMNKIMKTMERINSAHDQDEKAMINIAIESIKKFFVPNNAEEGSRPVTVSIEVQKLISETIATLEEIKRQLNVLLPPISDEHNADSKINSGARLR